MGEWGNFFCPRNVLRNLIDWTDFTQWGLGQKKLNLLKEYLLSSGCCYKLPRLGGLKGLLKCLSAKKNSACQAGDVCLIPGLWRYPGEKTTIYFSQLWSLTSGCQHSQVLVRTLFLVAGRQHLGFSHRREQTQEVSLLTLDWDLNPHGQDWNQAKTLFWDINPHAETWTQPKPTVPAFRT